LNDFQLAGLGFAAVAVVFIIAAVRSGREREHRVWMAVGAAIVAAMFALVFWDLGTILDRLQQGLEEFGQDLGQLPE
jgi:hypothetical protein